MNKTSSIANLFSKAKVEKRSIVENAKNTRLIYIIDSKLNKQEIDKLVSECEIEFFSIDTTNFVNVKDYYEIIGDIKESCLKNQKNIGIIASLAGRKIKVDNINIKGQDRSDGVYHLKKGQTLKIFSQSTTGKRNQKMSLPENSLAVNFKDIHKLVKTNDTIIINDNKGGLKVCSILEKTKSTTISKKFQEKNIDSGDKLSNLTKFSKNSKIKNMEVKIQSIDILNQIKELSNCSERNNENNIKNSNYMSNENLPDITSQKDKLFIKEDLNLKKIKASKSNFNSNASSDNSKLYDKNEWENLYRIDKSNQNSTSNFDQDDYNSIYREFELTTSIECDSAKDSFKVEEMNKFLKRTASFYTINIQPEEKNKIAPHKKIPSVSSSSNNSPVDTKNKRQRLLCNKLDKQKLYEIICEVQYDCTITKNSFLFVSNVDYISLGIDVLSKREVAEIDYLTEQGIDFICISIKSMKDIESIREVNSKIKIIASIPDYMALGEIDEIIQNTSGILLSRTFQILNKKTKNSITRLTKYVIFKCAEYGKPIFSNIDIHDDDLISKKKKKAQINEIIHNIIDGMDGFFLNVSTHIKNPTNKFGFDFIFDTINYFIRYFKKIQGDHYFIRTESDKERERENLLIQDNLNVSCFSPINYFIRKYDSNLEDCCIVYYGNDIGDIQSITKLKLISPLVVFSYDKSFLIHAKLFYSVISVHLWEENTIYTDNIKNFEKFLSESFPQNNIVFMFHDTATKKKFVKLIE